MPNAPAVASRLKIEDAEDARRGVAAAAAAEGVAEGARRDPVATARRVGRGWGRAVRSVRDAGAGGGRPPPAPAAGPRAAGARLGRERRGDARPTPRRTPKRRRRSGGNKSARGRMKRYARFPEASREEGPSKKERLRETRRIENACGEASS